MTIKTSEYKSHYKQFSQNIAFAARTWYHYVHLHQRAFEDEELLKALNKAPRFWTDHKYTAVQTTIIFLGKIFDKDGRKYKVHNIDKILESVNNEKSYFSKEELRKRKVESSGEFEGLDEYIESASELNDDDIKILAVEIEKAKVIWERIKPLRDKIYAHNEMLSDAEREALYKDVKNRDLSEVLQILLNVSNSLWEAEFNGRKPDCSNNYIIPIDWAKKDIEELISSIITPSDNKTRT